MIDIKERQTGDLPCTGWEGPCKNTNAVRYHMNTVYVINDNNYKTYAQNVKKRVMSTGMRDGESITQE